MLDSNRATGWLENEKISCDNIVSARIFNLLTKLLTNKMSFWNYNLVESWILQWIGTFLSTFSLPFLPSIHGKSILCSTQDGLGHVTCFGQWNVDGSSRVALPSICLQWLHMFLLVLWEHPPSTMRKHAPGSRSLSGLGPRMRHVERTCTWPKGWSSALSANLQTHEQEKNCLLLYASEMNFLGGLCYAAKAD